MKRVVKLLIALVIVAVVLVVGDRVAVAVVQNQAASAAEDSGQAAGVSIEVHGFPFLTQVVDGTLTHVTGSADTATIGGLSVTDVRVDAHNVGTSKPYTVSSGTATGAVTIGSLQATLREQTGLDLNLSANGDRLKLSGSVLGLDLAVDGTPTVLDASTLGVTIDSVQVGGATVSIDSLPSFIQGALTDIRVGLDLPQGISLDSVAVSGDTVRIEVSGKDVALEELVTS